MLPRRFKASEKEDRIREGFLVPPIVLRKKFCIITRNDEVLHKEESIFLVFNSSYDLGQEIRNVFLSKCGEFGTAKRVESRQMNMIVLQDVTKEFWKRQPKVDCGDHLSRCSEVVKHSEVVKRSEVVK
ncbi:hypothetical protein Tco_1165934 [Tanacetum coccineum]